jgi:DNA-binding NarL/FixJ family response regulator
MPGAVGYSGIALLHAERPEVPILVVSSAEGSGAADEARQLGAVGFLSASRLRCSCCLRQKSGDVR